MIYEAMWTLDGGESEVCLPLPPLLLLEIIITTATTVNGDGHFINKLYVPCLHLCR
jgi:hypothetical protein